MDLEKKTNRLVATALMSCLIIVTTMFFKIPIPFANGYVHLGDAMIFMSVLILGVKNGALASALGSAFGDILGGYAIWAPWTLVIKGLMAVIMGLFILSLTNKTAAKKIPGAQMIRIFGMLLAGSWMVFGYYIAEWVMYGNRAVALLGVPWNIGQFAVGMAVVIF